MKTRLLFVAILVVVLLAGFVVPTQAESCPPVYHVVKAGQNLTQIARLYGVTVQAIVDANNLWNPNLIYVGQRLRIPVPCTPPPGTGCTLIHVVKRGEYLKIIAARYGTTIAAIVNLNGIKNPNLIYTGQRLKIPTSCQPTPQPPSGTGNWKGQYWANRYFSGDPKFTRYSDVIDFGWGTAGPGGGIGGTNFAVRWTRTRYFDAGQYRFHVKVDDGARVWVDNVLIIDQWHDTEVKEYTADKQLSAGNHSLQVDYYQNLGAAQIKFWPERLDSQAAWKGEYFNNMNLQGSPVVVKHYNAIDFGWAKNAPEPGVSADYFSARFSGEFHFVGGKYRFTATVDDGMRIWVDDNLILDQWHVADATTYGVDVDLAQGNHRIKVEYYEEKGAAVCKLSWTQK